MIKMSSALPPPMKGNGKRVGASLDGTMPPAQLSADVEASSIDGKVIESLRKQLDAAHLSIATSDDEIARLQAAVNARELELARSTRASDLEDAGTSKAEQLLAADASNKRIIDQLNGQVDFLNEQLALREAQLVDSANKITRADEVQLEFATKTNQLEMTRGEVKILSSQLRIAESKIAELTDALNPEGNTSIDDLFDSVGSGSAKAMMEMLNESKSDSSESGTNSTPSMMRSSNRLSYSPPEATRSSGSGRVPSPGNPKMGGNSKSRTSGLSDDFLSRTTKALADNESKLVSSQRKLVGSHGAKGKPDAVLTRREHEAIVSQMNAEKDGLIDDVYDLRAKLESMQGGDGIIKERMKRGEEMLASVKSDLLDAENRAEALARQLMQKEEYLAVRESECTELQMKLVEAAQKLGSSNTATANLDYKVNSSVSQMEVALRERDGAQSLVESLRNELNSLRRERLEVLAAKDEAESKARILKRDNSELNMNNDKAQRELMETKTSNVRLAVEMDSSKSEVELLTRKFDNSERLLTQTQSNLNASKAELNEALNSLAMYQMSTSPGNVADQLRSDIKLLRQKVVMLEGEKAGLLEERQSLQENTNTLNTQRNIQDHVKQQIDTEKGAMATEIEKKNNSILQFQKNSQLLELEVDRLSTQLRSQELTISSMASSAKDREVNVSMSQNASQQLTSDVSLLTRRCVDAEEAYTVARRQSEKDQQALMRLTDRANTSDREATSLTELVSTSQGEIEVLQTHVATKQKQLDSANRQLSAERADLNKAGDRHVELEKKIQDLKSLLNNNESVQRSQALKNTRLLHTINEGEEGAKSLGVQIIELKESVVDKDKKLGDMREALKNLDTGRDFLQNQLDDEQERSARKEKAWQELEQKNLQLRQDLERSEKKVGATTSELVATQKNMKNLDARLSSLKEENMELKRRYGMKNADVAGAAEDLMLMTKENQALTAELAETSSDRDRLRSRVTEVIQKMSSLEHARKSLEVERGDLLNTYRLVLSEKRKLENELSALGAVKQRAGVNIQQMHGQMSELQAVVSAHSVTEKRWSSEKSAMVRQLETVNDQLIRTKNKVDAVEADNRRLMQDTHALRQTNVMLNERVQMVIKRATSASDANKVLTSRLSSVERERDAVRALVNAERQRAEDYGTIVETARAQVAKREVELQRLRGDGESSAYSVTGEASTVSGAPSNVTKGSSSSASSAAAAAAVLNQSLGLSDEDSILTPPAQGHLHKD